MGLSEEGVICFMKPSCGEKCRCYAEKSLDGFFKKLSCTGSYFGNGAKEGGAEIAAKRNATHTAIDAMRTALTLASHDGHAAIFVFRKKEVLLAQNLLCSAHAAGAGDSIVAVGLD